MPTLIPDPPPAEIEAFLERRRKLGLDRHDEVWEGVLHMSPESSRAHAMVASQLAELLGPLARAARLVPALSPFNLGESAHDYRSPDGGLFRDSSDALWNPTAALAVEILSPGDETWDKLPFYAAHDVDELLIVDPRARKVDWLALRAGGYEAVERSAVIDLGPAELTERIDWPPVEDG